jgi:hypothetical protein
MATRMQQRRGTAAEWTSADPILGAGEIGFETDTNKFKIGDDTTVWSELPYFTTLGDIVDGAPDLLDTLNELAAAIGDDPDFITTITSSVSDLEDQVLSKPTLTISSTAPEAGPDGTEELQSADLWFDSSNGKLYVLYTQYDSPNFWLETGGPDQLSPNETGISLDSFPTNPEDGDVHEGYYYDEPRNAWSIVRVPGLVDLNQISLISESADDVLMYNDSSFTWENVPGIRLDENLKIPMQFLSLLEDEIDAKISVLTVNTDTDWALDTSVPLVGSLNVELGSGLKFKLGNGVDTFADLEYVPTTDSVTAQISAAIADKADKAGPTFTGTVILPTTTSIGDVTSTEIGYLDGVTSLIQTQLDTLDSDKADLASPTFTGTVAGITSSMVGLGSVDNTSDADKPVSTAQQAALDTKLNLAGGTMTGKITLDGDPTQALHAVTKQYVDSVEAGLITRPQVRAATTANLDNVTYANGTAGVGATITADANGAFPLIDGVQLTTVNGNRGLLVKNQTNAAHNGRYNLTTQGTESTPWVLTRCGLCDEADEIPGSYTFVTDGTVNGQTGWVQHVDDPATFTVGTDDIDVYQFAGAGSITAGTNISVSGSQVSVIDAPAFSGVIDASASGVEFSDGIQTQVGVASLTTFSQKTDSYTLDTLTHKDNVVEMNSGSATTFTIPTNAALAWPIGGSMDIFQTGAGEVTIAASGGVTLNGTPGFKLRTQWSSATILKRGTDSWVVYGDLKS